jgi:hypothetical protein
MYAPPAYSERGRGDPRVVTSSGRTPMQRKQSAPPAGPGAVDNLPDGSRRHRNPGPDVPDLPTEFSSEQIATVYAAVAHAHFALATLRGADIVFPPGRSPPPELTLAEPGNQRFFLQLALLGMALEVMGLDAAQPIPLPEVRRQTVE